MRESLSGNGIGQLHVWKHVDGGDWQSITDYFEIGREANDYGLRNNLAYYLTSSEEGFAESLELVLNINVLGEGEYAREIVIDRHQIDISITGICINMSSGCMRLHSYLVGNSLELGIVFKPFFTRLRNGFPFADEAEDSQDFILPVLAPGNLAVNSGYVRCSS